MFALTQFVIHAINNSGVTISFFLYELLIFPFVGSMFPILLKMFRLNQTKTILILVMILLQEVPLIFLVQKVRYLFNLKLAI